MLEMLFLIFQRLQNAQLSPLVAFFTLLFFSTNFDETMKVGCGMMFPSDNEKRITLTEEVYHILSLSKNDTHVESNLMVLCKRCHSEITAREGGRWG